jgi:hypothetical protein
MAISFSGQRMGKGRRKGRGKKKEPKTRLSHLVSTEHLLNIRL